MTDKIQKATKVKCKREEYLTKQSMFVEYSLLSKDKAFEFCWCLLADEHNSSPKSTRRHIKLGKFIFGAPWLLDLLCKHWFASSVWNFCCWVADIPPRETSLAVKSEEKRMFSQATNFFVWPLVLKLGQPRTNPAGGQNRTQTQGCWIVSPMCWPTATLPAKFHLCSSHAPHLLLTLILLYFLHFCAWTHYTQECH